MGDETRNAAKRRLVALMQMGHSWQEAAAQAGIQVSRSTAYRWLQRVKAAGEASLTDGRHGHPAKVRGSVHEFLETTCRQAPQHASREIQAKLAERFGVVVSIGHLNRLRAKLAGGSRAVQREKNCSSPPRQRTLLGLMEQEGSSL
jgi:transposase